jgi:SNF2 family DNA or RNA helicase
MTVIAREDGSGLVVEGVSTSPDKVVLKNLGAKQLAIDTYLLPGVRASYHRLCRGFGREIPLSEGPKLIVHLGKHPKWGEMKDFQREAITFLCQSHLRGSMICLSPGLGKTAVSILAAQSYGFKRVLVIAPLTLLRTWVREIKMWGGQAANIIHGLSDLLASAIFNPLWTVTNYDSVVRHPEEFNQGWDLVILDESILVKNRSAKRTKVLKSVTASATKVWALSGSPTSRYLDDLFAQFQILLPKMFTSYWRFAEEYCYVVRDQWGWNVVGSRQNIDMQKEFEDIMFVRSMDDVIDLPKELQETIELDLLPAQKYVYNKILKEFKIELASGDTLSVPNRMAQLVRLQQVVSNLQTLDLSADDISIKFDCIEELLETERAEPPVLIWTHWIDTGRALRDRLSKHWSVALIFSDTPPEERQAVIDMFQGGKIQVLIISIGTGKYGITLTNANSIIYCDRSWDADAVFQSSFRVRRIGLDHSPVVFSLQCPGTTDDLVTDNLIGKFRDIARLTNTDLLALLERIERR